MIIILYFYSTVLFIAIQTADELNEIASGEGLDLQSSSTMLLYCVILAGINVNVNRCTSVREQTFIY